MKSLILLHSRIPSLFLLKLLLPLLLFLLLLLPLLLSTPISLYAQSGGFAGAHTRMGFNPRGIGMGNALVSVTDEGIYSYHNPAHAADVLSTQIDISTAVMGFGRSLNSLSAALRLPPNAGLYVGVLNANVKDIDGRTSSGYHTRMYAVHDYQLFTSFGIKPGKNVRLGATLKLNFADYDKDVSASQAFGMDFGLLITPSEKLRIGFAVQDLFSETIWNTADFYGAAGSSNTSNSWPTRITLGGSYRTSEVFLISLELEQQVQSSIVVDRSVETGFGVPVPFNRETDISTSTRKLRIGARHHIHERLTLRAGYQNGDLGYFEDNQRMSLGFSVHLPFDTMSPSIDYSVTREPGGISFMHAFAIRLNL
jgi:hypothetical protein